MNRNMRFVILVPLLLWAVFALVSAVDIDGIARLFHAIHFDD